MSEVVLDSCTLINLINANVLMRVCSLNDYSFFIGELVYEECCEVDEQKVIIDTFIDTRKITILKNKISISEFKDIKNSYSLGNGESESIALAKKFNYVVATDDSKARNSAMKEVGRTKLCGSIFLLRELVQRGIVTCVEAQSLQNKMKSLGGFLPKVDPNYLCK